jgi:hypothetical protein
MNAVTDAVAGHMNAVVIAVASCVIAVVTAFTLRSPGLRGRCCWRIEPSGAAGPMQRPLSPWPSDPWRRLRTPQHESDHDPERGGDRIDGYCRQ